MPNWQAVSDFEADYFTQAGFGSNYCIASEVI